jgi:hypothetical protein
VKNRLLAGGAAGVLLMMSMMVACGGGDGSDDPVGDLARQVGFDDRGAQEKTVAEIRAAGEALFEWHKEQVGAAAAGQNQIAVTQYKQTTVAELEKLLVPQYIPALPTKDGWGNPYEYYLTADDLLGARVLLIRSPGRDGQYALGPYIWRESFDPKLFDEDIVWADGVFIHWPEEPSKDR